MLSWRDRHVHLLNEFILNLLKECGYSSKWIRPGFTGCGTRLAAKPCLVGVRERRRFWRVPTGIALIFQEA